MGKLPQACSGARWASCPRWASLQVSRATEARRSDGDGVPGKQRAEFGTAGNAWSKGGIERWKAAEGAHTWSTATWREMWPARSPEEALLDGFSPGPKRCISAWIVEAREGSSASFSLWPAACWQMPHSGRAPTCRWPRARYQNPPPYGCTQPTARSEPLPFPAQGLLADGAAGKLSCKSSVVKQQIDQ